MLYNQRTINYMFYLYLLLSSFKYNVLLFEKCYQRVV